MYSQMYNLLIMLRIAIKIGRRRNWWRCWFIRDIKKTSCLLTVVPIANSATSLNTNYTWPCICFWWGRWGDRRRRTITSGSCHTCSATTWRNGSGSSRHRWTSGTSTSGRRRWQCGCRLFGYCWFGRASYIGSL